MTYIPLAWLIPFALSAAVAPTLLARRDWQSGFWAALTALASLAGLLATSGWIHG